LHTDSKYVLQGITEWLDGWKNALENGRQEPVKNEDLWRRLDALASATRHRMDMG